MGGTQDRLGQGRFKIQMRNRGNITIKGITIVILIVIAISAGAWYYFGRIHSTTIEKIFSNPTA